MGFLYELHNQRLRGLVQSRQSLHSLHTQNMETDKVLFLPVTTFVVCSSHLINILRQPIWANNMDPDQSGSSLIRVHVV